MKKQELIQAILENTSTSTYYEEIKEEVYDEFVIKKEDIKEEYFQTIENNYLNLGYGFYSLSKKEKDAYSKIIISEQQKSLDHIIYYFDSALLLSYSIETKIWALLGLLNLGNYNEETKQFEKRTNHTTSAFMHINTKCVRTIMDIVENSENKETIIKTEGSFEKLYTEIINKNKTKEKEGNWVKYPKNSDYKTIITDIESYGTNWEILDELTLRIQIAKGDIYIYYTKDEFGVNTIPSILITTNEYGIEEILSTSKNHSIEPSLSDKVMQKLKEFPMKHAFTYLKKKTDMNLLTEIYQKSMNDIELTEEELRFLYEIDGKISTFSNKIDQRLMLIKRKRNTKKDLAAILKVNEEEVGFLKDDFKNKNLKYYYGNLYIHENDKKILPANIIGLLDLSEEEYLDGIILPEYVRDGIKLNDGNIYALEELKQTKPQMKIYRK